MVGLLNLFLTCDYRLKFSTSDRWAEEGKFLRPTVTIGHVSRVAAGER